MDDDGLFRQEALRRFREGGTQGQVLRLAPGWTWLAVTLLLLALAAMALWAARAEVDTYTRVTGVVVSNGSLGTRTAVLRVRPTAAQAAAFRRLSGPLAFRPASGGGAIPIGRLTQWEEDGAGAIDLHAEPAPPTLTPGTQGVVEAFTGRVRLRDVLRPGRH